MAEKDTIAVRSFRGLRSDVSPERFAFGGKERTCDLQAATNVEIDSDGRIARRAGYSAVLAASGAHSIFASGDTCLFMAGTTLKRLHTGYAASVLRTGMSGEPVAYVAPTDCIYFSDHMANGCVQEGTARTWGLPVAPLPSVATTVGHMPAGDYQFAATYLRADGQEGGCGVAGRITLPAGGLVFGLPAAPPSDVAAVAIYLSTANGQTLYRALLVTAGQTLATYRNDTSELRYTLRTQFQGPPPPGDVLAWHAGTILVASGDTVYQSEPLGYELFDYRKFLQCDGPVTMMAPLEGEGVFIATDRSIGFQRGGKLGGEAWMHLADHGAVKGTLTYADGTLFGDGAQGVRRVPVWMSTTGIVAGLPGGNLVNLTRARNELALAGRGAALFKPESQQLVAVTTS